MILCLILILGMCWGGLFWWMISQQEKFLNEQLRRQARGIYHYIILTRQWIASYDGVYVSGGKGYDLVTPSDFSYQIADFSKGRMPFSVKIAVPGSDNPFHMGDEFETKALKILKRGRVLEVWEMAETQKGTQFRYCAPLIFEDECIGCHARKNDSSQVTDDMVGCVSISFSADPFMNRISGNKKYIFLYLLASLGIVLFLLFGMLRSFVLRPLNQLTSAANRIHEGDMAVRVSLEASEEWRRVGASFNQMVESLSNQQEILKNEVKKAVSDLAQAYEKLQRTEKYRSDFFSNITHELRTPITALKGAADLLGKKCTGKDTLTYIGILNRNIEKLSRMVRDLLDCAKMESGELELEKGLDDLAEVIEDAILMVMPLAWDCNVKISYEASKEKILISFDRDRLEQAVSNLLSNAIKFSPEGSSIDVSVARKEGEVVVSVEDYGPGIPEDERDLVFRKFFRRYNEKATEGMGLGLAIAKGIVEAHGGRIWISDPQHPGVILNISLPF